MESDDEENDVAKHNRKRKRRVVTTSVLQHVLQVHDDESSEDDEVGKWGGRVLGSENRRRGRSTWESEYLGEMAVYPEKDFTAEVWSSFSLVLEDPSDAY